MGISGYGLTFNEDTGYTELFIDREEVGNRFSLYFESPTTLLLGIGKLNLISMKRDKATYLFSVWVIIYIWVII